MEQKTLTTEQAKEIATTVLGGKPTEDIQNIEKYSRNIEIGYNGPMGPIVYWIEFKLTETSSTMMSNASNSKLTHYKLWIYYDPNPIGGKWLSNSTGPLELSELVQPDAHKFVPIEESQRDEVTTLLLKYNFWINAPQRQDYRRQ